MANKHQNEKNIPLNQIQEVPTEELQIDAEYAAFEEALKEEARRIARENPEMSMDEDTLDSVTNAVMLEIMLTENPELTVADIPELHYLATEWINDPLEELGGLTPLEAVKNDEYRDTVDMLLVEMDNSPSEKVQKLMDPIVADLRTQLGLLNTEE